MKPELQPDDSNFLVCPEAREAVEMSRVFVNQTRAAIELKRGAEEQVVVLFAPGITGTRRSTSQ